MRPSNCTFQSQNDRSRSHRPQEKATAPLSVPSWPWWTPGPQVGSRSWSKENVTQQEVCELWLSRTSDASVLPVMRKSHPDWFIHIHWVLLPFLMGLVEYVHFVFIAAGSGVTLCTSFIRDTGSLSSSCTRSQNRLSSSSTKSKAGRIGVLNWPLKSPHVSFYFRRCSTCIQQTLFHFCTLGIFKFKNSTATNN